MPIHSYVKTYTFTTPTTTHPLPPINNSVYKMRMLRTSLINFFNDIYPYLARKHISFRAQSPRRWQTKYHQLHKYSQAGHSFTLPLHSLKKTFHKKCFSFKRTKKSQIKQLQHRTNKYTYTKNVLTILYI